MPPRPLPQPIANPKLNRYWSYPQRQQESDTFNESNNTSLPSDAFESSSNRLYHNKNNSYSHGSAVHSSHKSFSENDSNHSLPSHSTSYSYNTSYTSYSHSHSQLDQDSYSHRAHNSTSNIIPPELTNSGNYYDSPKKPSNNTSCYESPKSNINENNNTQPYPETPRREAYKSFDSTTQPHKHGFLHTQTQTQTQNLNKQPSHVHRIQPIPPPHSTPKNIPEKPSLEFVDNDEAIPDYKMKIVCVGDGGCGKTSLMLTYTAGKFPTMYVPTVFENYVANVKADDGKLIELALWDTAGQEEYDRLRVLSYPGVNAILVCFGIDSPTSLENVIDKWVPEASHFCPGVPIILVGLKTDLRKEYPPNSYSPKSSVKSITKDQGIYVAKEIGATAYLECSARTCTGVSNIFATAVEVVRKKQPTKFPRAINGSTPSQPPSNNVSISKRQEKLVSEPTIKYTPQEKQIDIPEEPKTPTRSETIQNTPVITQDQHIPHTINDKPRQARKPVTHERPSQPRKPATCDIPNQPSIKLVTQEVPSEPKKPLIAQEKPTQLAKSATVHSKPSQPLSNTKPSVQDAQQEKSNVPRAHSVIYTKKEKQAFSSNNKQTVSSVSRSSSKKDKKDCVIM